MSIPTNIMSRRSMLRSGVIAGAFAALPAWARASDARSLQLIRKAIPSTGEKLPVIGLGENGILRVAKSSYGAIGDVLKRSYELGGRVIDTAANYGDSEEVVGKAIAEMHHRKEMFLATKFEAAGAMPDEPQNNVFAEESFERSLMRLQTNYIDLMQAHHLASVAPLMPLLRRLKKSGKVRYIGITSIAVDEHSLLIEYMRKYPIDFIQVDYSLGNRQAAEAVFPVARERRIAVLVAEPLGGRFAPGAKSLMDQVSNRELPSWASDIDVTNWSQFFLKYVISHPDVTCAIPGATKIEHLEQNGIAGRGRIADAAMRRRMEAFWDSKDA
jgi:aryl-alcohol dehydrogenase-like predicted oxidoreductase